MSVVWSVLSLSGPRQSEQMSAVPPLEPEALLEQTLRGDVRARERLAYCLLPIIHARVARAVLRHGPGSVRRNLRAEVEDLVQEICLSLFADECRILRAWSADRGLSLAGFVGLIARRRTISLLRARFKDASPLPEADLEAAALALGVEESLVRRDLLERAFAKVSASQQPLGQTMMVMLFRKGFSVAQVEAETGRSAAAIYQWRSRLAKALQNELSRLNAEAG